MSVNALAEDEYVAGVPVFVRVKKAGAPPNYDFRVVGYEYGNVGGIPVSVEGWIVATARYKIIFECDVCGKEVHEDEVLGNPVDVKRSEGVPLASQLEKEVPLRDREILRHPEKHFFFQRFYLFQCPRCGRWVGKGAAHQHCRDDEFGLCKYCGNVMRALLKLSKNCL